MQLFFSRISILVLLVILFIHAKAQKSIAISDSLAANAEQLHVKQTQGLGKWRLYFGDFNIVTSKVGWTVMNDKVNLWGTASESNSKTKFSFVLCNSTQDTATVNATNYTQNESLNETRIFNFFQISSSELKLWYQNFTAFITINGDTTDTWALLMNGAAGSDTVAKQEAYLVNSNRKILLVPVTSAITDKRTLTAYGYEFFENGQPVGALQYYGGGLLGWGKMMIWIDRRLNPKTKLVLAAAMAAAIKLKQTEL